MPGDVELLYEDGNSGQLGVGPDNRAFRNTSFNPSDGRPSLVGPVPRYGYSGQTGLGGTLVEPLSGPAELPRTPTEQSLSREPSPDELLQWAQSEERDIEERKRLNEAAGTAVDPALIRTGYAGNQEGVPEWLKEYMDAQPHTDPYGPQTQPSAIDNIMRNKYLTEQEKRKYVEAALEQQRKANLR